jgi:glycine betaine/proline transport system ATP-binding protein
VVQIGTPSEVVMHPATDYVAEFTRDVPRVKVITARDVMGPVAIDISVQATIPVEASLEVLIPRFSNGVRVLGCTDAAGAICGHVTAERVLAALAAADEARPA